MHTANLTAASIRLRSGIILLKEIVAASDKRND